MGTVTTGHSACATHRRAMVRAVQARAERLEADEFLASWGAFDPLTDLGG